MDIELNDDGTSMTGSVSKTPEPLKSIQENAFSIGAGPTPSTTPHSSAELERVGALAALTSTEPLIPISTSQRRKRHAFLLTLPTHFNGLAYTEREGGNYDQISVRKGDSK